MAKHGGRMRTRYGVPLPSRHEVEAELAVAALGVRSSTSPAGTLTPSITILKCWMVPSMVV